MACIITDECISCGICIGLCPNNAVFVNPEDHMAIDTSRCTECVDLPRRRCETICTVGAIQSDPNRRESAQQRWEKHRALRAALLESVLDS